MTPPPLPSRPATVDGSLLSLQDMLESLPSLRRYQGGDTPNWAFMAQLVGSWLRPWPVPCRRSPALGRALRTCPTSISRRPPPPRQLQEHPVLGEPWYMLHPCQTADRMALLVEAAAAAAGPAEGAIRAAQPGAAGCGGGGTSGDSPDECSTQERLLLVYMRAWFSLVAPLVGLPAGRAGACTPLS